MKSKNGVLFLALVVFSFVNISQVIGWEGWVFCTSQEIGCEDPVWNNAQCDNEDLEPYWYSTHVNCWQSLFCDEKVWKVSNFQTPLDHILAGQK